MWLGFLRGHGRERRYELSHPLAAAVRTTHVALVAIGDMQVLGEFLIAILTMKDVLRHGDAPGRE